MALLEKWSFPAISQRLPSSFADYDPHVLAAALHHQMSLYHDLGSQVAATMVCYLIGY